MPAGSRPLSHSVCKLPNSGCLPSALPASHENFFVANLNWTHSGNGILENIGSLSQADSLQNRQTRYSGPGGLFGS